MSATILVIVAFQAYWITKLYNDEWVSVKKRSDILLKETVQKIIAERLKKNNAFFSPEAIETIQVVNSPQRVPRKKQKTTRFNISTEQPFPVLAPRGTKIETMVFGPDTNSMIRTSKRPNIDSLVAAARAMGQRYGAQHRRFYFKKQCSAFHIPKERRSSTGDGFRFHKKHFAT
jgi:hypothetical protein